jgi:hypothetical protein
VATVQAQRSVAASECSLGYETVEAAVSAAHGPDSLEAILPLFPGLFVFLRAREALMFLSAFGTFLSVVSAFVMSHKPDLRPLLEP